MRTVETKEQLLQALDAYGACVEARAWVAAQAGTAADIWAACARGDWMLWFAAKQGIERQALIMTACQCARLALIYVPAGDLRPLRAIETAEAWCRGEATLEQVKEARRAAAAAAAAYAADAAYAAHAAAYAAAYAAYDDAAYDAAAYAAYAAAYDADAAAAADAADVAQHVTLNKCADIVRQHITLGMVGIAAASPTSPIMLTGMMVAW